jgi:hypothetical protein
MRRSVRGIVIATTLSGPSYKHDPFVFGIQASTTSRMRPYRTLYSAEPICEFHLAKAGFHADSHVRTGDIKGNGPLKGITDVGRLKYPITTNNPFKSTTHFHRFRPDYLFIVFEPGENGADGRRIRMEER